MTLDRRGLLGLLVAAPGALLAMPGEPKITAFSGGSAMKRRHWDMDDL